MTVQRTRAAFVKSAGNNSMEKNSVNWSHKFSCFFTAFKAHSPSQSMSTNHSQVAEAATLIANFYGERGHQRSLIDHLVQSLAVTPQTPQVPNNYSNVVTGTLLRHFDPSAAHDTTIIQVALNSRGEAKSSWEAMRKYLETILPHEELLKDVWGYTLIYQAELVQDVLPDVALITLLPAARRLYSSLSENPQMLAQSDMSGGRLWLIDIPIQGEGLQAATVYLALSQPNSNNRLVLDVLYNKVAALLMIDLIAHKFYHQTRQYRLGDLDEQYRYNMETLLKHTDALLSNLSRVSVTDNQLNDLANEYGLLVSAVVHLDQLYISLMRQEFNFNWWRKQAGGGDIVEFHHSHLEEAAQELRLLVAEGQQPLKAASTTVEMMRAQLEKQREGQQHRIETILVAATTVFSILVLIDKDTARALLEFIGISQPISIWLILGVQASFIAIFSLLIYVVGKIYKM